MLPCKEGEFLSLAQFIGKYIEDFLILSGLGVIVWVTFRLNSIAGMLCFGVYFGTFGPDFKPETCQKGVKSRDFPQFGL